MFELALEILLQLVAGLYYAFFGALVGVLWPAKSPEWARKQRWCIVAGLSSVVFFTIGFVSAYYRDWGRPERFFLLLACLAMAIYMILGNQCRKFHETALKQKEDAAGE